MERLEDARHASEENASPKCPIKMEHVVFFEATKLIKMNTEMKIRQTIRAYCWTFFFFFIPRSIYFPEDFNIFYSNIAGLKKTDTRCPTDSRLGIKGDELSAPHKPLNMIAL